MSRALLGAVLALALLAAAAFASVPNADQIRTYHDSGKWDRDIKAQATKAQDYLKGYLKDHAKPKKGQRPAIVLDIDDTSVSLYRCAEPRDFEDANLCAVQTDNPAIKPVRTLFRYAKTRKVAVFLVTGRPEGLRALTLQGLRSAGYSGWKKLYLRPADYDKPSLVPYKSGARKEIQRSGYRIVVNVGDQRSDLRGGYSLRTYKLPNPMYSTP